MRHAFALLVVCAASCAVADDLILLKLSSGQTIAVRMSDGTVNVIGVFETVSTIEATPVNPPTPSPVARVTYVYEKDQGGVPPAIAAELQRLNGDGSSSVVASEFEEDTVNGEGQTPTQYVTALAEARKVGLPAIVVERSDGTVKAIKSPTVADITEALK